MLPICGLGDLTSIYAELKSIHLRTLNRERGELLAEAWLASGDVLSAREVCTLSSLACTSKSIHQRSLNRERSELLAGGLAAFWGSASRSRGELLEQLDMYKQVHPHAHAYQGAQ